MGFQNVMCLPSRACFPPHFLRIVVEVNVAIKSKYFHIVVRIGSKIIMKLFSAFIKYCDVVLCAIHLRMIIYYSPPLNLRALC